jgi:hypothetical protein
MDQLKPIERIGAALKAAVNLLEAAAGVNEEISDELSETRARMFDPSPEQEREALATVLETMPLGFQRQVIADLHSFLDSPDEIEWKPLTARVVELVELRLYQCPRPLAMPESFCHAYVECEPGHLLKFNGFECEDCAFAHPLESWYEGRQERGRPLFETCVLCGSRVSYNAYAQKHRRSALCHTNPGSDYRVAMANNTAWLDAG